VAERRAGPDPRPADPDARPAPRPGAKVRQANFTFTHEGDDTKVYKDFEESPKPDHVLYRAGTFDNPHARQFAEDTSRSSRRN
jgi:hypothetical protein